MTGFQKTYQFQEKIWLYPGKAAWHFVTLPPTLAKEIDYYFSTEKKGWGALTVEATIGETTWKTAIFPDKQSGSYLLPLKAAVRKSESLRDGSLVAVLLQLKTL